MDLRAAPEGVNREALLTRLHAEIRIEYGPLDVSQEETIYLAKMVSLDGGQAAWDVRITHSVDLDLHSISDKRENSNVSLLLDHELRPVGRAKWERLTSFHKRIR